MAATDEIRGAINRANLDKIAELAGSIADLNQTIAGPSIAEVQDISDKVDELLAALRAAFLIT